MALVISMITALFLGRGSFAAQAEQSLYNALFTTSGYNRELRPVTSADTTINITMGMELLNFGGIDEVEQTLTSSALITSVWTDELLTWNLATYNNLQLLVVSPETIWLPDFVLINSVDKFYYDHHRKYFHPEIKYTGEVTWKIGGVFITSCTLDMTYYPFDKQTCSVILQNWVYSGTAIDLYLDETTVDTSQAGGGSGLWKITSTSASISYADSDSGVTYAILTFDFNLERKSHYYVFNLIAPAILLFILTLTVYWLPADSGEKIGFSITILLSFAVFLLVVQDSTPKDSDHTSLLSIFFVVTMVLSTLSALISVIVLYFNHKQGVKRPARWLRWICFRVLMRVMCFSQARPEVESPNNAVMNISEKPQLKAVVEDADGKASNGKQSELQQILEILKEFQSVKKDKDEEDSVHEEYVLIARVIDRLCFWLTLICFVISSIVMFTRPL